jgi:hypothetical protein
MGARWAALPEEHGWSGGEDVSALAQTRREMVEGERVPPLTHDHQSST